jgi:5-deoxy-D-glucuronate isomerase
MSYPWSNDEKLLTLKVGGESDVLTFETGQEKAEVYLVDGNIERVVCSVSGTRTVINREQAHHVVVGEGNAQRDVYHYLKPNEAAPSLRLGITKHRGFGTWSSLPHPFELIPELGFEEVFFHLLKGGSGRAIQVGKGVWCDGTPVDQAWFVRDHSWSTIPMGYHPVVGEPEVHVSYIWAYPAKKKQWEKI